MARNKIRNVSSALALCASVGAACVPDFDKVSGKETSGGTSNGGTNGEGASSASTSGGAKATDGGRAGDGATSGTGASSSAGRGAETGGDIGAGGSGAGNSANTGGDVSSETGGKPPTGTTGGAGQEAGSGGAEDMGGSAGDGAGGTPSNDPIVEEIDVGLVWSGHPVSFPLVTKGDRQFIAYYDPNRQMTFAMRRLGETTWQKNPLPSVCTWDSHQSIRLGLDPDDNIHVSGNMHNTSLVYFRTSEPLNIGTFAKYTSMIGSNENSMTYPEFLNDAKGDLLYNYRNGGSGDGNTYFNKYSTVTKTWSRLYTLTDGQGQRNSYPVGPILGPDGYWHIVWTWRDSANAETNHDLSYAKSKDLSTWTAADGRVLSLPITLATSDVVDRVQVGGGLINNNTKIGFDAENRVIVVYHKYESPTGATQLYNARFENGAWVIHQTTSRWGYRWNFSGQGTLIFPIELDGVKALRDGTLTQRYYHSYETNIDGQIGWGCFRLNPDTLVAEELIRQPLPYPAELGPARATSDAGILSSRWAADSGQGPDPDIYYMARWETLDSNRDQAREKIPEPTQLKIYGFRYSAMATGL